MELKEGQKLRVKEFNERPEHWISEMDSYKGKIVTIKELYNNKIFINEDLGWRWKKSDFQIVFYKWEDVCKFMNKKCANTKCCNCNLNKEIGNCYSYYLYKNNYKQLAKNFEKMFEMECYVLEEKEFTKSNLKNGMTVEYRNGKRRIKIDNKLISLNTYHGELCEYYDNLICKLDRDFDIMKVYDDLSYYGNFEEMIDNPRNCIYERKKNQ